MIPRLHGNTPLDTTRHRNALSLTSFTLALMYLSCLYSRDRETRSGFERLINNTMLIRWAQHGIPGICE